ncbi:acyltransferase [Lunatibacter salilacus]|uniref:acyltransferase n=1 Tax=Lunatibacter salilacus TaxID=2483804 RepID=UPI00131DDA82|nr:acyltransferase [Lunatibacter salilacus]
MVQERINEKLLQKSIEIYGRAWLSKSEKRSLYFHLSIDLWIAFWRLVNGFVRLRSCATGKFITVRGNPRIEGRGKITIGDHCRIWSHMGVTQLYAGPRAELTIGNHTFVNTGTILSATNRITIGNNVQIANQVILMDGDFHGVDDREKMKAPSEIIIEDDVWIATRSMILKGVTVGKGSTVAAGSVVTKDVPPFTLVGGVPAKIIRYLNKPE